MLADWINSQRQTRGVRSSDEWRHAMPNQGREKRLIENEMRGERSTDKD